MWATRWTDGMHRHGRWLSREALRNYAPSILGVRAAMMETTELSIQSCPQNLDMLQIVDGVVMQSGDIVLIIGVGSVGYLATVGSTKPCIPVPIRTMVVVHEGMVYKHSLFVCGDTGILMRPQGTANNSTKSVVPFSWNDVEWTAGQLDIDRKTDCLLIPSDSTTFLSSIAYNKPQSSTIGPHAGEALLMVRGVPQNQPTIFSIQLTVRSDNSVPLQFWVGVDCLDANGEMHSLMWSDPAVVPVPTQSQYNGTVLIPVGAGLKVVSVTDWRTTSDTTPMGVGDDLLPYPVFSFPAGCQVVIFRMGCAESMESNVFILAGQVQLQ
jgi:hypothetical protein